MIQLSLVNDFSRLERSLMSLVKREMKIAISTALTRTAIAARADIKTKLPEIFDRPTPFTVASIRYSPSSAATMSAAVYISDDAPKGVSPRNYLGPEIAGGGRRDKRSERQLKSLGMMDSANQLVPSRQLGLDRYGNVSGPLMTQVLSRVGGFGEQGYSANAGPGVKKRLAKQRRALRSTGTDYFVAKSKQDGRPLGIYQLVGRGHVRPVLIFARKAPVYKPRLMFAALVAACAAAHFPAEMRKALHEEIARGK